MNVQRMPLVARSLPDGLRHPGKEEPFYLPVGDEVAIFEECHRRGTGRHAQGADRLRQDPLRRAHGVAAPAAARDRGLPRRPLGQRPRRDAT